MFNFITSVVSALLVSTTLAFAGCSSPPEDTRKRTEQPTEQPSGRPTQKSAERVAPPVAGIKVIPGVKYYAGGPVLAKDSFGRSRIKGYNGEVRIPPAHGLVIARREIDGGEVENFTYINGQLKARNVGFLDKDGLLWPRIMETFSAGAMTSSTEYTYDDEAQISTYELRRFDPKTGEVTSTRHHSEPYSPEGAD